MNWMMPVSTQDLVSTRASFKLVGWCRFFPQNQIKSDISHPQSKWKSDISHPQSKIKSDISRMVAGQTPRLIFTSYRAVPAEHPRPKSWTCNNFDLSSCGRLLAGRKDGICKDSTFCICALMLLLRRESCVDTWKCWKPIGQGTGKSLFWTNRRRL